MKQPFGQSTRPIFPLIMMASGLLLIAGAIIGGMSLIQAPTSPRPVASNPTSTIPVLAATDPLAAIPRVSLDKAKEAFDNKTAVFVDVRDSASFANGHIPGAISIPVNDLSKHLNELKQDAWIITYCT